MNRIPTAAILLAVAQAWTGQFTVKVQLLDQTYRDGTVYLYWQKPNLDAWRWNVYRQDPGGEWRIICSYCNFENNFEVAELDTNLSYAFKVQGFSRAAGGGIFDKDTASSDTFRVVPKYRVDVSTQDSEIPFSIQSPIAAFNAVNQTPLWTEGRLILSDTTAYRIRDLKGDMIWKSGWSGIILPDSKLENLEIGWTAGECRDAYLTVTYRLYFRLDTVPDQQVDTVALKAGCVSGLISYKRRYSQVPAKGTGRNFDATGRIRKIPARPHRSQFVFPASIAD